MSILSCGARFFIFYNWYYTRTVIGSKFFLVIKYFSLEIFNNNVSYEMRIKLKKLFWFVILRTSLAWHLK